MKDLELNSFANIFTVISDSKTKIKTSAYLQYGEYAVVDQGRHLIAGYTNTSPTVTADSLPVIVFGDHTRAVKFIDFPFTAGADGTRILKPSLLVNPKYAYYLLLNTVSQIPSKGYARHFGELKKKQFPIPSPADQQRIVEKLDKAFAEIDKLEKNLGFSKDKVTQLWQSVLRSTFTEQTDLQEVGELSTSRVFREETIEEICNVEYGTRVVRKRDAGTLYPVYGGGGETFFIDSFNREDRVVIARFALSEKCTRRVIGKFALNDSGLTLSPKDPKVLRQDYLDYFILSMNDQIYESARGTAQKNLDVPAFRRMKVVYPTSSETQMAIVQKLDSVFTEIEAMRNKLKIKSERLIELRMSLLHHAFNTLEEVA